MRRAVRLSVSRGLINGLAGKFLTSIVGLMVANLFTFIEKPMVSRLMHAHHDFLGLMDQLFPRKTMEQILEQLTSINGEHQGDRSTSGEPIREQGGGWGIGLAGVHGQSDFEYSVLDQIAGGGACEPTTHDVRPVGSHQTGASSPASRIKGKDS